MCLAARGHVVPAMCVFIESSDVLLEALRSVRVVANVAEFPTFWSVA